MLGKGMTIGYHGTTLEIAERLIAGEKFLHSDVDDNWLGRGVYFWEASPSRAKWWAERRVRTRSPTAKLAVVAAEISLDGCLDLLDLANFGDLRRVREEFLRRRGASPASQVQIALKVQNGRTNQGDAGWGRNYEDRLAFDFYVRQSRTLPFPIKSIRCPFIMGRGLHRRSFVFNWSHVQLSVVDLNTIGRPQLAWAER